MYHNGAVSAGAGALAVTTTGGGMLAATGAESLWLGLAAFALVTAGQALWRIVPRREA